MVLEGLEAGHAHQRVATRGVVVGVDHLGDQFGQRRRRRPAQLLLGLGRIAQQRLDLGRAVVARVDAHDDLAWLAPGLVAGDGVDDADLGGALALEAHGHAQAFGGHAHEVAHAVLHAGGDDEVLGVILLQHHPLHLHVVARMAPVAQRAHVAQIQRILQAQRDPRDGTRDLARDEGLAAQRALVVEQHAVAGVHAVGLAVVHRDPVGVELGDRVRAARIERRGFLLRDLLHQAVQLGRRRLVEARLLLEPQDADRLKEAQRADAVGVGRVLGLLEADRHMALRREVVDLVGLHLLHDAREVRRIRQVTVVQDEVAVVDVRILVQVIDAIRVEGRGAALDAVDFVAFLQQEFRQIGAVLARDAGDEGYFFVGHRMIIHEARGASLW